MARLGKGKLSWKIAAIGTVFAILLGVGVAAIIYRSQDVEQDQTVFPLALSASPNPFPSIGLNTGGQAFFTFELTILSSSQNPNLTLKVFVQPSAVLNLSISQCLENSQPDLSAVNNVCTDGFLGGPAVYFANVTSGSGVMMRIQVLYIGTINEPVSVSWHFHAEGGEIP